MFRNVGKKVKAVARIFFVLDLVITVLLAACAVLLTVGPGSAQWIGTVLPDKFISGFDNANMVTGIVAAAIILIAGFLISLISNWVLYAIGEAADNKGQIDYLLLVLDERKAHATSPKQ